jgi:EVE domain-containing protein
MRSWLAVVCRAHVERGVEGGFAQVCHGKQAPLQRMQAGDWLVYYSPAAAMGGGERLQAFTALGQMAGDRVYRHDMGGGFVPFRRKVRYQTVRQVPLCELRGRLHLTARAGWGVALRRGHLPLDAHDFGLIAAAMGQHPPLDPSAAWTAVPSAWWYG